MRLTKYIHSLLAQSFLWIAFPLIMVIVVVLVVSALTYQQVIASLLIDRDRQLATLSANRVSQAITEYASSLEWIWGDIQVKREMSDYEYLNSNYSLEASRLFSGGILVVDDQGEVLEVIPSYVDPVGEHVFEEPYFQEVRERKIPTFSGVMTDARTGNDMVVLAIPFLGIDEEFRGALLGAIHLHTTSLGEPVRNLIVGDEGFAYLVDDHGRVIFHPDPNQIGADFSDRLAVTRVNSGEKGGMLGESPSGEKLVQGYAPVEGTRWGLIVREPWEAVIEPVRLYGAMVGGFVAIALLATMLLLWRGVLRITSPIRLLVEKTLRLAKGEKVEPVPQSGVQEIDVLAEAFDQMAAQIHTYRAGLRRYVGTITSSQEEERKRIARELHDETIQNLVGILRQLELRETEQNPHAQQGYFRDLRGMVEQTIEGVRRISRDLRSLALEDLGLIPAIQILMNTIRTDDLDVDLIVSGKQQQIPEKQELALYRIAQEALSNARKHARASEIQVKLGYSDEFVEMEIIDDGIGFDTTHPINELANRGSYGLLGIQERVWDMGGLLEITSNPGNGTHLRVRIPLRL